MKTEFTRLPAHEQARISNRANLRMVAAAVAVVALLGLAREHSADAMTVSPGTSVGASALAVVPGAATYAHRSKRDRVWQEDELPRYLTLWADRYGADLVRAKGKVAGHKHCWFAIATRGIDATRVACPDGFRGES